MKATDIGLDGCPKADAMLRQVDPYGMTQREGGLSGPPQYGWAPRHDGDWEFRDPAIPNLAYLKSRGAWLSTTVPPEFTVPNPQVCPPIRNRVDVRGMTDFVLGGDGQVTAERGLHFLQPLQPFIVSEGGLTVSSLYGAAQSPRAHDYEFHLSNPHLHGVDPAAPIPAGTRVYVPHRWTANLRGAGYGVHRPTQTTGIGGRRRAGLGDAASIATMLTTLQNINGAIITPDGHDPLGAVTYGTFVQSQKAAGQLAVDQLGPDINITLGDLSKPFTQQAWVLNGQLAALNSTGTATIDDANQAKSLLAAIIQQQLNALNAVVAATPLAPSPGSPNTDAPHVPVPTAPGVPTPRASASAQQLTAPSPGASAAAVAAAAATAAAAAKEAADKAAGTISTPWIIGGVVGGAALLGIAVAVLKKKKAA